MKSLEPRRGNDDRCEKKSKRKKSDNHSKINFKCWHLDANIAKEEDLISLKNLDKKLKKAEKFSCDIAKMSGYEGLISELDNLTGDICQSTEHFAKLDVDRTLPKEKQKSQAKNIVHQKRRALADLFKTLQLLGLSYRTGLSDNHFGVLEMCTAPPLNQSGESDGFVNRHTQSSSSSTFPASVILIIRLNLFLLLATFLFSNFFLLL